MFVLHRKMIVQLLRTWAVLFLALGLSKAEVTLENGAYRNLLVSFSPNLPRDAREDLLNSTRHLLESASEVLHTALGVRIADVTFLLPDSWDVSGLDPPLEVGTSSSSLESSDVLVEAVQDSPFGKAPLAVQFGGCGVPGSHITIPQDFLKSPEEYPKGKLLAREWLKYRYGVFDENGFPGDSLYPSHYWIPGIDEEVLITDCTNEQVEYIFKDFDGNNCSLTKDSNSTCEIHPGEMISENVTSSLMYFHKELPNLEHVCGKEHLHNYLSPSKQNILCDEKSIWEVLGQSPDFKAPVASEEYAKPEFHYVKGNKLKVALLFESTNHLNDKKDELLFALRRFVYELQEGSHLSIDTFMADASTSSLRPLSELTGSRGNIINSIPFDTPATDVCPLCALDVAVNGLLANGNKEGSIILIVGSSSTKEDNSALVEKLKNSQLCLKIIALKDIEGYNDFLSQLTCQSFEQIPNSDDKAKTFDALFEIMATTLPHQYTETPSSVVTSGIMSQQNEILIKTNPTAEDFTIWFENPLLKTKFTCIGKEDGIAVELTNSELQSNLGVYSFASLNKDVACKLKFDTIQDTLTQVQMKTKPGHFFTESVWIHDPTPAKAEQQMPIIVYAKINFGSYPVSGAKVTARVTDPDGNVGEAFELYDNGKGDPDITKDDGIYSRYFFGFTKAGRFLISVEVNDNGGMAKVLKKGEDRCCGSEVKTQVREDVPTFKRSLEIGFDAVSAKPEQGYPPSKIIDLRVENYQPPTLLELKWTAPGGEVDSGKASGYVFKVFCDNETDCRPDGSLPGWISTNDSKSVPKEAGQEETIWLLIAEGAPMNSTIRIGVEAVRLPQMRLLLNQARQNEMHQIFQTSELSNQARHDEEVRISETSERSNQAEQDDMARLFQTSELSNEAGQVEMVQISQTSRLSQQSGQDETIRLSLTNALSNRVQVRLVMVDDIEDPVTPTPEGDKRNPAVQVGTIVGGTVVGILVLFCIIALACFLFSRSRRSRVAKSRLDGDSTERSDSFKGGKVRPPSVMRRVESFPVLLYTHDQIKDVKNKTKATEPPLFRTDVAPKPWVSLGELQQGDKGSDGSASTIRLNDNGEQEMKQLSGASVDSDLQTVGKVAKF